jgi:hypothetical protein
VGGLVVAIAGLTVTIDDGSAQAVIRLPEAARSLALELAVGDPLNVVGRVVAFGGGWAVEVAQATDVWRVGRLSAPSFDPSGATEAPGPGLESAGGDGTATPDDAAPAALAALSLSGALGLFGAGVALVRRRRTERLFSQRLSRRLAEIAAPTHEPRSPA